VIFFTPPANTFEAIEVVSRHTSQFPPHSQRAAADAFARFHSAVVRWCVDTGRWLAWDGRRWVDNAEYIVSSAVGNFLSVYAAIAGADEALGRTGPAAARAICSQSWGAAVMKLLESDGRLWVRVSELDVDDWALNCANGVVDLRTGELMPHDPGMMVTHCSPIDYDPHAPIVGSRFERFLGEVFCGDEGLVTFAQHALGYSCTGDNSIHFLLFMFGDGRNGKSTIGELAAHVMGGYARKIPSTIFAKSGAGHHEGHPTEIAQLRGVRLAFSSEIGPSAYWSEDRIKEMTGDAELSARFMHQDFFTFRRTHKHLIYGNHRPRLRVVDDAITERIKFIDFNANFIGREEVALPERLREEGAVALRWLAEGAAAVWAAGRKFPYSETEKATTSMYMREADTFGSWVDENCVVADLVEGTGNPLRTPSYLLYADYHAWKRSRGELPESIVLWARLMSKRFRKDKHKKRPVWLGVGLRFEPNMEDVRAMYPNGPREVA
jgi:putative DNA primase/helicase